MRRITALTIGAAIAVLGTVAGATPARAASPGANGLIAFTANGTGSFQIYTMRPNGSDIHQLTHTSTAHNSMISAWSPDGRHIAFDSDKAGRVQIFVMTATSGTPITHPLDGFNGDPGMVTGRPRHRLRARHRGSPRFLGHLLDPTRRHGSPAAHPLHPGQREPPNPKFLTRQQADRVHRFAHAGPASAIFVMRANGSHMRRVTPLWLDAGHPGWSRDGSKIIFNSGLTKALSDIFTIHTNGTQLHRLTHVIPRGQSDFRPDYSPDGTKIVFNLT